MCNPLPLLRPQLGGPVDLVVVLSTNRDREFVGCLGTHATQMPDTDGVMGIIGWPTTHDAGKRSDPFEVLGGPPGGLATLLPTP